MQLSRVLLELKREQVLRKQAYNRLREELGNVRVVLRIRPPHVAGVADKTNSGTALSLIDEFTVECVYERKSVQEQADMLEVRKSHEFDRCFGPDAGQEAVF